MKAAALLLLLPLAAEAKKRDPFPGGLPATSTRELPKLRRSLREGDWNARIHAVHRLGRMGEPGKKLLAAAAQDADWQVRFTAVHWLGRQGKAAIPELRLSLSTDPCPIIRISAVHWLGSFGKDAVPALEEGLLDGSGTARASVWRRLHQLDPEAHPEGRITSYVSTVEELNVCLNSPFPVGLDVRAELEKRAASEETKEPGGFRVIRSSDPETPMPEQEIARLALLKKEEPVPKTKRFAALEEILAGLPEAPKPKPADYAPEIRREAPEPDEVRTLLEGPDLQGDPKAPLAPPGGLKGRPVRARKAPAGLADDHGSPPYHNALPGLLSALKKGDVRGRTRAADEIGALGPEAAEAVPVLIRTLRDKSPRVRASAAIALGKIGWAADPAVPRLIRALRDPHPDVRYGASEALGRIGTPAAHEAFQRYLRAEAGRL